MICAQVIECVRVMLEAGADPTLQTSRQAMMTDRIYKERFFPHELLADENGAPATDDRSETIRGMLLDAIAERGGLPSQRAQDLAAARQRAAHRQAVTDAAQRGGDPIQRAGCNAMMSHPSSRMQVHALKLDEAEARARMKKSGRARVCDFCNKRSETKLRACGKCKFVFYCDAACQRKAWPTHKKECGSALDRLCVALERNGRPPKSQCAQCTRVQEHHPKGLVQYYSNQHQWVPVHDAHTVCGDVVFEQTRRVQKGTRVSHAGRVWEVGKVSRGRDDLFRVHLRDQNDTLTLVRSPKSVIAVLCTAPDCARMLLRSPRVVHGMSMSVELDKAWRRRVGPTARMKCKPLSVDRRVAQQVHAYAVWRSLAGIARWATDNPAWDAARTHVLLPLKKSRGCVI